MSMLGSIRQFTSSPDHNRFCVLLLCWGSTARCCLRGVWPRSFQGSFRRRVAQLPVKRVINTSCVTEDVCKHWVSFKCARLCSHFRAAWTPDLSARPAIATTNTQHTGNTQTVRTCTPSHADQVEGPLTIWKCGSLSVPASASGGTPRGKGAPSQLVTLCPHKCQRDAVEAAAVILAASGLQLHTHAVS